MIFVAKAGEKIFIKVINMKRPDEWSIYRITVGKDAYKGEGLDDIFLAETTGYEEE